MDRRTGGKWQIIYISSHLTLTYWTQISKVVIHFALFDSREFVWHAFVAYYIITVASQWVRWHLKSPASRLFTQSQIKENIKAPCHWPLWGGFTGEIPAQKASKAGNVSIWWRHNAVDCQQMMLYVGLPNTKVNFDFCRIVSKISSTQRGKTKLTYITYGTGVVSVIIQPRM